MTREELRKRCPIATAFVDDMRKAFGDEHVKALYVKENGVEIGKRAEEAKEVACTKQR